MVRRCAAVLLGVALVACPAIAKADAGEDEARRATLYREGVTLADSGHWAEAVKRFREVVAIRSAPPALFSLAQAEEKVGQLATAERTYERALTDARAASTSDVADAAKAALAAIEGRVPRLVVRVPAGSGDATATLDGANVAIDAPIHVDPGARTIAVVAPGKAPYNAHVVLSEGQSLTVDVVWAPESAPPPVRPPPPPLVLTEPARAHAAFPAIAVVLGAVGLVATGVGVGLFVDGYSTYDAATSSCPNHACTDPNVQSRGNGARSEIIAANVVTFAGIGVAAVATIVGVVVWSLSPRRAHASASSFAITF